MKQTARCSVRRPYGLHILAMVGGWRSVVGGDFDGNVAELTETKAGYDLGLFRPRQSTGPSAASCLYLPHWVFHVSAYVR